MDGADRTEEARRKRLRNRIFTPVQTGMLAGEMRCVFHLTARRAAAAWQQRRLLAQQLADRPIETAVMILFGTVPVVRALRSRCSSCNGSGMPLDHRSAVRLALLRIIFFAALALAVVMALLPKPPHVILDDFGDKFEHSLAFVTLTVLARFAFPGTSALRVGESLSFLGALIEVFQSIPALHRDCDVWDWIFDTGAITLTLLVLDAALRLRRNAA